MALQYPLVGQPLPPLAGVRWGFLWFAKMLETLATLNTVVWEL
jgi:hypothetical protein